MRSVGPPPGPNDRRTVAITLRRDDSRRTVPITLRRDESARIVAITLRRDACSAVIPVPYALSPMPCSLFFRQKLAITAQSVIEAASAAARAARSQNERGPVMSRVGFREFLFAKCCDTYWPSQRGQQFTVRSPPVVWPSVSRFGLDAGANGQCEVPSRPADPNHVGGANGS